MTQPPILSASEPFVDRYRRVSEKWYPWLRKLFDTLRTNEAAIVTVTESVTTVENELGTLSANWTIALNANEHIVGRVTLSGNATGSDFTVVADTFAFSVPGGDGTEIPVFAAGLVDGVATWGMAGNIIIDGTILARHISVTSLSAVSASFGDAEFTGVARGSTGAMVIDFDNETIDGTKMHHNLLTGEFWIDA